MSPSCRPWVRFRVVFRTTAACLLPALFSCNDGPAAPGSGTVEVTTVSTGEGLDQNGYIVELQGLAPTPIGINATATMPEAGAGDLEIRLTSVRGNCAVQGPNPRLIRVVAGETFRLHFDVTCVRTPLLDRIVFSSERDGAWELYSMNADGGDQVRLTDTPDDREVQPASSPDGTRIAFTDRVGPEVDFFTSDIYVMNADGTGRVRLTDADGWDEQPVWSPDGSRIAFQSYRTGDPDIWVMEADGTGQRNLTNSPASYEASPIWSPDGDRILFTTLADTMPHLDIINVDGSGRTRLSDDPADAAQGIWSPDGSRVAFLSTRAGGLKVFTMNADGSDPVRLTPDDGSVDLIASWSPGGDRIAFANDATGDVDVYLIGLDGTGLVDISNNAALDNIGLQAWGP